MAQDTLLGFPAHTLLGFPAHTLLGFPAHTLPYRCGGFTTLSTVSVLFMLLDLLRLSP